MNIVYDVIFGWGEVFTFEDGKKALDLANRLREGCKDPDRKIQIELKFANENREEEGEEE